MSKSVSSQVFDGPAVGCATRCCASCCRSRASSLGLDTLLEASLLPAVAGRTIELCELELADCAVAGRLRPEPTGLLGTRTAPEDEIPDLACRLLPMPGLSDDDAYPFFGGERFSLLPVIPGRYIAPTTPRCPSDPFAPAAAGSVRSRAAGQPARRRAVRAVRRARGARQRRGGDEGTAPRRSRAHARHAADSLRGGGARVAGRTCSPPPRAALRPSPAPLLRAAVAVLADSNTPVQKNQTALSNEPQQKAAWRPPRAHSNPVAKQKSLRVKWSENMSPVDETTRFVFLGKRWGHTRRGPSLCHGHTPSSAPKRSTTRKRLFATKLNLISNCTSPRYPCRAMLVYPRMVFRFLRGCAR